MISHQTTMVVSYLQANSLLQTRMLKQTNFQARQIYKNLTKQLIEVILALVKQVVNLVLIKTLLDNKQGSWGNL